MCTYNGARFLPEQLASVSSQTQLPDEVIICDDCSTDGTRDLLQSFARTVPFAVRIHQNEQRLGSTRNFEKAIRFCTGEIIALADQDDVWREDKLELIAKVMAGRPEVGLAFSNGEVIDEATRLLGYTLWDSISFKDSLRARFHNSEAFEVLQNRTVVTGATMAFRSTFRDLVLPIPVCSEFIHDSWIALMVSTVAELEPINESLIFYRRHAEQQIGAPHPRERSSSNNEKLTHERPMPGVRWTQKPSFAAEINRLRTIRDGLRATGAAYPLGKKRLAIEQRLAHFEARASIEKPRVAKTPVVLRELVTLRYHRYSNGLRSALKDLLC